MPFETFEPPISPDPGTPFKPEVSLNEVSFGDGYVQSSPKGLNHVKETMSLKWGGLTTIQFEQIRDFIEGKGGYTPFYYTPRGRSDAKKWTCKKWSYSDETPWSFEAEFTESFVPDV